MAEQQARNFLQSLNSGKTPEGSVADTANVTAHYAFAADVAWAVLPSPDNNPTLNAILGIMAENNAAEITPATIVRAKTPDGRQSISIPGTRDFAMEMVATSQGAGVLLMINKSFLATITVFLNARVA